MSRTTGPLAPFPRPKVWFSSLVPSALSACRERGAKRVDPKSSRMFLFRSRIRWIYPLVIGISSGCVFFVFFSEPVFCVGIIELLLNPFRAPRHPLRY